MKLKYLFPLLIAMLTLMTSCADEETVTLLDEVQVSSSYVALPVGGGSSKITVTAQDSWTAEKVFIMDAKDKTLVKDSILWLTISTTTGSAGESELTFTAPSAIDGRTAEVFIKSGGKTQRIKIMQGLSQISEVTVAQAKAAPDGKTVRLSGVVTTIENTIYGNWRLTDDTGEILIYGTLDAKGATQKFASLGIEVGDGVTIEGPKSTHTSGPQLVNVMVIKINKSLIKVDSVKNAVLSLEGGEFTAMLTVKGQGVSVDIPEDAKSWLSISSIQSAGTNAVVKFKAAPNNGGDRKTTITFHTTDGKKDYTTQTILNQKGAIVKATVAEFNAAVVSDIQYRLTGVISKIGDETKGRLYLKDFSGETYVYGIQDFTTKGLKVGDIITIVGKRAEYKGPQVASSVLESVKSVTPITVAELLTKVVSTEVYYKITGEITNITNPIYGNHFLKEGGSSIEVYGCYPGYGATGDFRKNLFADKNIKVGDQLTVIGTRGNNKEGVAQLANGIYFSHESAN
ncbi:MAG: BACON domain-containing protein [Candidatus Saccharimonadaceae bacterium]